MVTETYLATLFPASISCNKKIKRELILISHLNVLYEGEDEIAQNRRFAFPFAIVLLVVFLRKMNFLKSLFTFSLNVNKSIQGLLFLFFKIDMLEPKLKRHVLMGTGLKQFD